MIYGQLTIVPSTLDHPSIRPALRAAVAHRPPAKYASGASGCYSSVYPCDEGGKVLKVTKSGDGTSDYLDLCWELTKSGAIEAHPWAPRVFEAKRFLVHKQVRELKPAAKKALDEAYEAWWKAHRGPSNEVADAAWKKYRALENDPSRYYYVTQPVVVRTWIIERLDDTRRHHYEPIRHQARTKIREAVAVLCPWLTINDDHSGNYLWSSERECWVLTDPSTGSAQNIVKVPLVRH